MGTDIHLHVEVRIGDVWHHWHAPKIRRNYNMFGIMAGVRGDGPAIVEPRGMPADITVPTRLDFEHREGDWHTPSWFGVDEIVRLEEWLSEQSTPSEFVDLEHTVLHTYLFGNSFTGWHRYPDENEHDIQDVRFVFWFDN